MDCVTRASVSSRFWVSVCSSAAAKQARPTARQQPPLPMKFLSSRKPIRTPTPSRKPCMTFSMQCSKETLDGASARLTPEAMQRIVQSGKQFAPPGLESATFRIGEVRSPSDDQAIVQCVLTDSSEGQPHSEEMCCLLRKVENDWRVCGIAYGTTADKPWTLTDFESGQNMAIPRQVMGNMAATAPGTAGQPQNNGVQANAAPVTSPAAVGMPPVARRM